ncbi:GTA-gp10 family protein [Oceanicaulis sp. MMSF_3324]|uniref:GTA-gp10 family protein n=1 Tax=Oceanicaulis sp. MMSF_3324 TaxID=3046702 RepID=UPI00273EA338|nr:GTA-gp10 family protein [Oceanicaulis sp. MMSF_3324]
MTISQPGNVSARLGETAVQLRLSLAALMEIEKALGVSGMEALAGRFRTLTATDLTAVLRAVLRAGGHADADADALAQAAAPHEAAQAVLACFDANLK